MLYFLVVFLQWARRGSAQSIVPLTNPLWLSKARDPQKPSGVPSVSGKRSILSQPRAEEEQEETQRSGEAQDGGIMGNSALGVGEGRQGTFPRGGKSWNWILEDQKKRVTTGEKAFLPEGMPDQEAASYRLLMYIHSFLLFKTQNAPREASAQPRPCPQVPAS